ncbi:MAG: GNAT family N-acetyltransferase [Chloroflexi bacterium]|nr:GNAT family N-acetyltransferase [Chloroflexota bacterium]
MPSGRHGGTHNNACRVEVYRPSIRAWKEIRGDIVRLEREAFGEGAFEPWYLRRELNDRANVVVLMREGATGSVVGFTCAAPFVNVEGGGGATKDTAYVLDTVIDERSRGQGLVGGMMRLLEAELRRRGFRFLERDAAVAHGYAANIAKAYAGRIVHQGESHESEWGPQVRFRIRL